MHLKSYFAASVEAAMQTARRELGDEAMLVYSRQAGPEARHLGSIEVVFAAPAAGESSEAPARNPAPRDVAGELGRISREMAALRGELETHFRQVREQWPAISGAPEPTHAGGTLAFDSRIGLSRGGKQVVALAGPSGAGKTTTLVKLAAQYGVLPRRPVHLVSMDNFRIGGGDQLRTFAAILGLSFQAVDTVGGLAALLAEHRSKDLVLVDTPGVGPAEMELAEELAAFLAGRSEAEVHLTLSANTKPADLMLAVDRFQSFRPAKLIFTKLDETASPVSIEAVARRARLPISFVTNGQQIPEDLLAASPEYMVELARASSRPLRPRPAGVGKRADAPETAATVTAAA